MGYLPIWLEVGGRRCVVAGGGEVAERKVEGLLSAGAEVTVISPVVTARLDQLIRAGKVRHIARKCAPAEELRGAALVYAACDDAAVNRRLARAARAQAAPVNVADAPALSTFITPAVVRRGALAIAVSTGGASPAMAGRIRKRLERSFGPEYGVALTIMSVVRQRLKAREPDGRARAGKLRALAASELVRVLGRGDMRAARGLVLRHTGVELGVAGETRADIGRGAGPACGRRQVFS